MKRNECEIVISGISGRYPESDNLEEFKQNLFNGVNMVTDDDRKWPADFLDVPKWTGKLKTLSKFDADFFGVTAKQADTMDPQARIALEVTHEAIIDAGVNPTTLRGTRTGVFIGCCDSDNFDRSRRNYNQIRGRDAFGGYRSMICNNISYYFDLNGPSYMVDTACSSSLTAFQQAYHAIKTGQCDAAIVGGVSIHLQPQAQLQLLKVGVISRTGSCKFFDAAADGFVRSESISVALLQKSHQAKRWYGTILGACCNADGFKRSIAEPSRAMHQVLYSQTCAEANVHGLDVGYVEAHGTGTRVGDRQEGNSLTDFYCKDRRTPLLVGSVKSNMGHSEGGAGLCAITKAVIAMETGLIPQNLHFQHPNPNIPGLFDKTIQVVTENTPLTGDILAVNGLGFGGSNAHVILKANTKPKGQGHGSVPHVIGVSGCTHEAITTLLDQVEQQRTDLEFLALLHEVHQCNIPRHLYRGYMVLDKAPVREISQVSQDQCPIWFIYSGPATESLQLSKDLLQIEVVNTSLQKSAQILKPYNINLDSVLTSQDKDNRVIGVTAIQIALTDLLKHLEIVPNGLIGYGSGELLCGYADGSLSHEQTLLIAHAQSVAFKDSKPGAMATIELTWDEVQSRCPANVYLACHNSFGNVTISGDGTAVERLIEQLKSEGVKAEILGNAGLGLHCEHVAHVRPKLVEVIKPLVPESKPRSSKWISTSHKEQDWGSELCVTSSAEYFAHVFGAPVWFYEASKKIPEKAICIQIGQLQGCLQDTVTNVRLVENGGRNSVGFLLAALGKLYNAGVQPKLHKLYAPIQFPVGRGTANISSFIKWDHSKDWRVNLFNPKELQAESH